MNLQPVVCYSDLEMGVLEMLDYQPQYNTTTIQNTLASKSTNLSTPKCIEKTSRSQVVKQYNSKEPTLPANNKNNSAQTTSQYDCSSINYCFISFFSCTNA